MIPIALTDASVATAQLRAAGYDIAVAEPGYVRHKPGETTIVAYRLTRAGDEPTWAYAHICQDERRAAQIYQKAASLRPRPSRLGPGLTRLDAHTVFYAFPNDARLRRLRWYTDPRKIKRSLEKLAGPNGRISGSRTVVDVLRYKPERRVVARVDLATTERNRPLLVRYSTRRQAHHLARVAAHLRSHGINTPAPILQLDGSRVTVDEYIGGSQLRDAIRDDAVAPADLAGAIGRFHATDPPARVEHRTAAGDLARLIEGLAGLGTWHPELTETARRTVDALQRLLPSPSTRIVTLHGDLHAKNVLVDSARLAFIDLERVAVGPPAIDLGFLRAHTIALGVRQPGWSPRATAHIEAVTECYRWDGGVLSDDDLAWHTAIGLAEQALLVARHLEGRWQTTSAELLELAQRQLDRTHSTAGAAP